MMARRWPVETRGRGSPPADGPSWPSRHVGHDGLPCWQANMAALLRAKPVCTSSAMTPQRRCCAEGNQCKQRGKNPGGWLDEAALAPGDGLDESPPASCSATMSRVDSMWPMARLGGRATRVDVRRRPARADRTVGHGCTPGVGRTEAVL